MRFLRVMSENDHRTAERSRAVDKPEGCVYVVGEGEGKVANGVVVPNVVAEPRSCSNQAVSDMTSDHKRQRL